jgi:hypothetical protein
MNNTIEMITNRTALTMRSVLPVGTSLGVDELTLVIPIIPVITAATSTRCMSFVFPVILVKMLLSGRPLARFLFVDE